MHYNIIVHPIKTSNDIIFQYTHMSRKEGK
jgi:hypothetical protein